MSCNQDSITYYSLHSSLSIIVLMTQLDNMSYSQTEKSVMPQNQQGPCCHKENTITLAFHRVLCTPHISFDNFHNSVMPNTQQAPCCPKENTITLAFLRVLCTPHISFDNSQHVFDTKWHMFRGWVCIIVLLLTFSTLLSKLPRSQGLSLFSDSLLSKLPRLAATLKYY